MTELKPCPFCGGETIERIDGPTEDDWVCFRCEICMSRGPTNYTDPKSIIAWNTRAAPVVTDKMVDAAWQVYAANGYDADLKRGEFMDRLFRAALVAALEVKG